MWAALSCFRILPKLAPYGTNLCPLNAALIGGGVINTDIQIEVGDFEIPIKYTTDATHLPPPAEIGKEPLLVLLEAITKVGSLVPIGATCHSHFGCAERGKRRSLCRGGIGVTRRSKNEIEWVCEYCHTRGIVSNFLGTEYDASDEAIKEADPDTIYMTLPNKEYKAIDGIRGLPQDAHYAMILAKNFDHGHLVECSESGFRELAHELAVEVGEGLCAKSKVRTLMSAEDRILECIDCRV